MQMEETARQAEEAHQEQIRQNLEQLADDEARLEELKTEMQDARALFNQYSSETPPADFTEELKEQYEFAFYDKEAEFKEL